MKATDYLVLAIVLIGAAITTSILVPTPIAAAVVAGILLIISAFLLIWGLRKLTENVNVIYQNQRQENWERIEIFQKLLEEALENDKIFWKRTSDQLMHLEQILEEQQKCQKNIEEFLQAMILSLGDNWHAVEQHWEEKKEQYAIWIKRQEEQAMQVCKAIEKNQKVVEELRKHNSEGQVALLDALERMEKNSLQEILSQLQNQAEDQNGMAEDIRVLKKINREMADKTETALMQFSVNSQNQLDELKEFLKHEGETNREHYRRLADTYAQLTTQDVQLLQELQEQINE